ncbi:hypothetical protein CV751_29770, partial [Achromobacter ruhlandii]
MGETWGLNSGDGLDVRRGAVGGGGGGGGGGGFRGGPPGGGAPGGGPPGGGRGGCSGLPPPHPRAPLRRPLRVPPGATGVSLIKY